MKRMMPAFVVTLALCSYARAQDFSAFDTQVENDFKNNVSNSGDLTLAPQFEMEFPDNYEKALADEQEALFDLTNAIGRQRIVPLVINNEIIFVIVKARSLSDGGEDLDIDLTTKDKSIIVIKGANGTPDGKENKNGGDGKKVGIRVIHGQSLMIFGGRGGDGGPNEAPPGADGLDGGKAGEVKVVMEEYFLYANLVKKQSQVFLRSGRGGDATDGGTAPGTNGDVATGNGGKGHEGGDLSYHVLQKSRTFVAGVMKTGRGGNAGKGPRGQPKGGNGGSTQNSEAGKLTVQGGVYVTSPFGPNPTLRFVTSDGGNGGDGGGATPGQHKASQVRAGDAWQGSRGGDILLQAVNTTDDLKPFVNEVEMCTLGKQGTNGEPGKVEPAGTGTNGVLKKPQNARDGELTVLK